MRRMTHIVIWAGLAVAPAPGGYWIAYEGGPGFPEEVGPWRRIFGDEKGPKQGGAERRIEGGVFVLDSLRHRQIFDFYETQGIQDPQGVEQRFVAEWRLRVDPPSDPWDAGIVIARDRSPGHVALDFGVDRVQINTEPVQFRVEPGVFHTYRFESRDMDKFDFFIDDLLVHQGRFETFTLLRSFVNFGDGVQGLRSLSRWDFMRFGVVGEPMSAALLVVGATVLRAKRAIRTTGLLTFLAPARILLPTRRST